jgi:hypothetical protein
MALSTQQIIELITRKQEAGELAVNLTARQVRAIAASVQNYLANLGESFTETATSRFEEALKKALQAYTNPQVVDGKNVGLGQSPARLLLTQVSQGVLSPDYIDFALETGRKVMFGAARHVAENDPERVKTSPALEFRRKYDRDLPRGYKKTKGGVIPVPDEAWPARWQAAGEECGDTQWLPWEGDDQTGRGVALKSSGIWQSLGDGAGGYTDTLGNPFSPFAFRSGFGTYEIPRAEAVELGLLDEDEEAQPAPTDFENLFAKF